METEKEEKRIEKEEKRVEEEESFAAKFTDNHQALINWDNARRAKELNERAIIDVMFINMEGKLEQGKNACNDLLKYVKEVARCQQEFVKSFGKLGNALDERYHYGTLEDAVIVLKMHSINSCSIYEEHNKILTETIAVQLSQLVTDYSKQSSKVMEAGKKASKDYDSAREASNKAFAAYLVAFDEFLHYDKTKIIPAHDPLMAEKNYQQSLEVLKTERDKSSAELEQIFEAFVALELKRIEATRDVLQTHAAKQRLINNRLTDGIASLEKATEEVNTEADKDLLMRQSFNRRAIANNHLQKLTSQIQQLRVNQAHAQTQGKLGAIQSSERQLSELQTQHSELRSDLGLPLGSSPSLMQVRTESNADLRSSAPISESGSELRRSTSDTRQSYNQLAQQQSPMEKQKSLSTLGDSPMQQNFSFRNSMEITEPAPTVMEPPKTGYLFRKSKIMKSWKQTHCVLSSCGYLYIYTRKEKPTPKYVVPLSDVAMKDLIENEDPNVFELVVNQHSFFPTKYQLQAESQESLNEWMSLIKTYSGSKK